MKILAIAGKEFQDVLRERSLVTAFVIQLFLAGFSTLLLAGLTVLYSPEALDAAPNADIAYTGPGGFDAYLEGTGNLRVETYGTAEALEHFRNGNVSAVVEELVFEADGVRRVTLLLADGELESTLLVTQMKSLLLEYEADLREQRNERLELDVEPFIEAQSGVRPERPYTFVYSTLLPLLIVTPVFLSGAIAGDALSQEARTRTLMILRSAPIKPSTLIAGKLTVPILLVPFQVVLWLALFAWNGFGSQDVPLIIATSVILAVLLTTAGLLVAALVPNETATQAAYALLVLLLAGFSLLLPRDPLNVLALLASGGRDADTVASIAIMLVAAVGTAALSAWVVAKRIRTDRL